MIINLKIVNSIFKIHRLFDFKMDFISRNGVSQDTFYFENAINRHST